jgi:hypothetical protein
MLSMFQVKSIFNTVRALLTVDRERRTADLTMTVDGRIHRIGELSLLYASVDTPEKAEALLRQPTGELGNFMERYHHLYGRGTVATRADSNS